MKSAEEWMKRLNQVIRPGEKFPVDRAIVTTEEIRAIHADALESALAVIDDRVTLLDASYRKNRTDYTGARLDEALRIQELIRALVSQGADRGGDDRE